MEFLLYCFRFVFAEPAPRWAVVTAFLLGMGAGWWICLKLRWGEKKWQAELERQKAEWQAKNAAELERQKAEWQERENQRDREHEAKMAAEVERLRVQGQKELAEQAARLKREEEERKREGGRLGLIALPRSERDDDFF